MIADWFGLILALKKGRTIKSIGDVYSHKLPAVQVLIMADLFFTCKRSVGTGCVGGIIDRSLKKAAVGKVPLLLACLCEELWWLAILIHIVGPASFRVSRPTTDQTSQTKCNFIEEIVKQIDSKQLKDCKHFQMHEILPE
jgi:hypothetical protein